ncbi:MAG: zinc ABC transporter substrate-binding protein [Candidatus Ancillula sp.]|jgi:zinc/manganese transport system substrate-binding protein|nr:zinc ABC transporter substrate-binding protein [Candidatus Ancillula sp.]
MENNQVSSKVSSKKIVAIVLAAILVVGIIVGVFIGINAHQKNVVSEEVKKTCGEPIKVVATVNQWGSLAKSVGGDCVQVDTIISGTGIDPHDYEPTADDISRISNADIIIANGLDYDDWATKSITTDQNHYLFDIGDTLGKKAGDNPHLWYDPNNLQYVIETLHDLYKNRTDLDSAKKAFDESYKAVSSRMTDLTNKIWQDSSNTNGKNYAASETVANYLAEAMGMENKTPENYKNAAENGSETSPQDLNTFLSILKNKEVDFLFYNTQETTSMTDQIKTTAEDAGVKIIDVTEQKPDNFTDTIDWISSIVDNIIA